MVSGIAFYPNLRIEIIRPIIKRGRLLPSFYYDFSTERNDLNKPVPQPDGPDDAPHHLTQYDSHGCP